MSRRTTKQRRAAQRRKEWVEFQVIYRQMSPMVDAYLRTAYLGPMWVIPQFFL